MIHRIFFFRSFSQPGFDRHMNQSPTCPYQFSQCFQFGHPSDHLTTATLV